MKPTKLIQKALFVSTGILVGFGILSHRPAQAVNLSLYDHTVGDPTSQTELEGYENIFSIGSQKTTSGGWQYDSLRADQQRRNPLSSLKEYTFNVEEATDILLSGFILEGHAERGCDLFGGNSHSSCTQSQKQESFEILLNGESIFTFNDSEITDDNGVDYENAWYQADDIVGQAVAGENTLVFRHLLHGQSGRLGPESVAYNFEVFAQDSQPETPGSVPEPGTVLGALMVAGIGLFSKKK